jgi:hypothetical protein
MGKLSSTHRNRPYQDHMSMDTFMREYTPLCQALWDQHGHGRVRLVRIPGLLKQTRHVALKSESSLTSRSALAPGPGERQLRPEPRRFQREARPGYNRFPVVPEPDDSGRVREGIATCRVDQEASKGKSFGAGTAWCML